MTSQGIQQHAAQQKAPAAIRDGRPHGQRAGDDKRHDCRGNGHLLYPGKEQQKNHYHIRPAQNGGNGSNALGEFFLPQPVDALPDDAQQRKILKNSVQRVEAVPAPEGFGVDHKEFQRRHSRADSPDADKIPLAVMGVGKALHRAEQKQRCTEPPQHTEHRRDAAGELEEIMNVVQHHQRQRDGLELGTVQPLFR